MRQKAYFFRLLLLAVGVLFVFSALAVAQTDKGELTVPAAAPTEPMPDSAAPAATAQANTKGTPPPAEPMPGASAPQQGKAQQSAQTAGGTPKSQPKEVPFYKRFSSWIAVAFVVVVAAILIVRMRKGSGGGTLRSSISGSGTPCIAIAVGLLGLSGLAQAAELSVSPPAGVPGKFYELTITGGYFSRVDKVAFFGENTSGKSVWAHFQFKGNRTPWMIEGVLGTPADMKLGALLTMRLVLKDGKVLDIQRAFGMGNVDQVSTVHLVGVRSRPVPLTAEQAAALGANDKPSPAPQQDPPAKPLQRREPVQPVATPGWRTVSPPPSSTSPVKQQPAPVASPAMEARLVQMERELAALKSSPNTVASQLATISENIRILRENDELLKQEIAKNWEATKKTQQATKVALEGVDVALKVADVAIKVEQAEHDKKAAKRANSRYTDKKFSKAQLAAANELLEEYKAPPSASEVAQKQ